MTQYFLVGVLLILLTGMPVWPWSRGWGWLPVLVAGSALVVMEVLILVRW